MQHLRMTIRWSVIEKVNNAIQKAKKNGEKHCPQVFSNGDTLKELLARSRYLLYVPKSDWTVNQAKRGTILFDKYPLLEKPISSHWVLEVFIGSYRKKTLKLHS